MAERLRTRPVKRTLHKLQHSILTTAYQVKAIINSILQMRKPRYMEVKQLVRVTQLESFGSDLNQTLWIQSQ